MCEKRKHAFLLLTDKNKSRPDGDGFCFACFNYFKKLYKHDDLKTFGASGLAHFRFDIARLLL